MDHQLDTERFGELVNRLPAMRVSRWRLERHQDVGELASKQSQEVVRKDTAAVSASNALPPPLFAAHGAAQSVRRSECGLFDWLPWIPDLAAEDATYAATSYPAILTMRPCRLRSASSDPHRLS